MRNGTDASSSCSCVCARARAARCRARHNYQTLLNPYLPPSAEWHKLSTCNVPESRSSSKTEIKPPASSFLLLCPTLSLPCHACFLTFLSLWIHADYYSTYRTLYFMPIRHTKDGRAAQACKDGPHYALRYPRVTVPRLQFQWTVLQ